ncbi:hypothetical protein ACUN9Y_10835 [Halomonas sp. V046]|uniref:hypothetical protein n=1 Tax=Halomonas sp. V046 TaxID=3459611 RepID=UPI004043B205
MKMMPKMNAKMTLVAALAVVPMLLAGQAFAMDSEMLDKRLSEINMTSDMAVQEARVEALEEEVQALRSLLQEVMAADSQG